MALTTTTKGRKATTTVTVPSLTEKWRQAQEKVAHAERLFLTAQIRWGLMPDTEGYQGVAVTAQQLSEARDAESAARVEFTTMVSGRMSTALNRGSDPMRVQGLPR